MDVITPGDEGAEPDCEDNVTIEARAAIVEELPGLPVIGEMELSEPGPGEILVRTAATGVCHSDLHGMHGLVPGSVPFVLGHEPAGIVERVGVGVRHLAAGDHVVACVRGFCGHCVLCLTGRSYLCSTDEWTRSPTEPPRLTRKGEAVGQFLAVGGFASHLLLGQHNVVKIRQDMPLGRACLLACGVMTGVGAVMNTAQVGVGETVVVVGCGGVGLSVVQGANLAYAGAIVAVDVDDAKLELSRALGATHLVNSTDEDAVDVVRHLTGGGADHVFEAVGLPATRDDCLAMTGPGGCLTLVGYIGPSETMTLTGRDIMCGRRFQKSIMGSSRFVQEIPRLVEHYLAGRLDLDHLVGEERCLDELPQSLAELEDGLSLGRTVITFS
jgi:S-(hydroxymethyl)glutathione dehydrogenase / alcohol dehydrogenase